MMLADDAFGQRQIQSGSPLCAFLLEGFEEHLGMFRQGAFPCEGKVPLGGGKKSDIGRERGGGLVCQEKQDVPEQAADFVGIQMSGGQGGSGLDSEGGVFFFQGGRQIVLGLFEEGFQVAWGRGERAETAVFTQVEERPPQPFEVGKEHIEPFFEASGVAGLKGCVGDFGTAADHLEDIFDKMGKVADGLTCLEEGLFLCYWRRFIDKNASLCFIHYISPLHILIVCWFGLFCTSFLSVKRV